MTNEHRYILDKSSKKHLCPACGKKRFVCYIDIETGGYLPKQYGRCDREANCSYHVNPYTDRYGKKEGSASWRPQKGHTQSTKPVFIPVDLLKQTLQGYEQNTFLQNLLHRVSFPFEAKDVEKVVSLYYLGTICNGYRTGSITFPFIDINNNIRAIQVKQFDNTNHTTGTDFLHSIIKEHYQKKNESLPAWLEAYQNNEKKISCLFGEHLLNKYPLNPVALVEAPKTAIYGSLYFGLPDNPKKLLWLAVYNLSSLNFDKCKELKRRDVYLFPDLSKEGKAFQIWSNNAKEITKQLPETNFTISNLLEQQATEAERLKGLDLADYLIKQDWRKFKPDPKSEKSVNSEPLKKTFISHVKTLPQIEVQQPPSKEPQPHWNITELETFFAGIHPPTEEIKLNDWSTITDLKQFVKGHIAIVKAQNGKRTFLPYFNRLQDLKNYLENNKN